jgi:RHS repeat-associated protein
MTVPDSFWSYVMGIQFGRRAPKRCWLRSPRTGGARKVVAATTGLAVAAGLIAAVVVASSGPSPGPPVQQSGTAAGHPHRVPASATIARLVNGRVVQAASGSSRLDRGAGVLLPASSRPRGAVPAAQPPPRLNLGAQAAQGKDRLQLVQSPAAPVKGFSPSTSRVLPADTSASQIVYQNADGTRTAMLYQAPVNYRRPDGSWARIDTSLMPDGSPGTAASAASPAASPSPSPSLWSPAAPSPVASPSPSSWSPPPGGWRERSAAEPETFAPYADDSLLMLLPLGGKDSVGLGVQGAAHAAGSAQGDTVTYAGVRPDADLRLVAGAGMADEQLILHSRSAPDSWVFPLRLDGLTARTGPGGIIEFADAAGKTVAFVAQGLMTDSNINPQSGDGATSAAVSYTLTTAGGQPAIRMSLDAAWLDASARVYPVTVDPSVNSYNSDGTTYVQSPGSADYSGDTEIHVGTYDGGTNVARSFMKFDGVSSLTNDNVLGVRLGLFNSWSYSCSPRPVYVYPVTSSWSVTGGKSYPGPSIGSSVGSKSFATGWVQLGLPQSASPCPNQWEGIDLNEAGTNLVNGWTHGTTPNYGLALGASSSDSYGWKKFTSDNATDGDPFLSVTYSRYGAAYDLASSKPVQQVTPTQDGEIAIKVTNTGVDTWTPTNGYELSYEAYNSKGKRVTVSPQIFTPMPSTVAPGASVTVNAKVGKLPVGSYAIDFDMYAGAAGSSPMSFLSQGVAPFAVGLYVPQPPPVVTAVYPPTGFISPTVTPELSTTASSTTGSTITYKFSLTCQPLPGSVCPASTVNSGNLTTPYWTTPALTWDEPYTWTVTATTNGASTTIGPVTITPEVPQPVIASGLGGTNSQAFDPQSGNFTTSATDAAVAAPGPALKIRRTYNSLDATTGRAFGAGWSSVLDSAVIPDGDGSGNVVVALPGGQQMRFGFNTGGTYAPPAGSPDVLTGNSDGTWTLMDASGSRYKFTSGGQLQQITDKQGLTQAFTENSAGEVTTITDTTSGRALHLTWSTPAGAANPHVASVTTDPPASGGSGLTWTYSYSGDDLSGVCAPTSGCTSYTYGTGSDYLAAVLGSGPRSYWQFGDASGSAHAADEVDANLGTTNGSYSNVTLGAAGPLAGNGETAASFDGTSSYVSLPASLIDDQSYVSVGLWFKAASSTASGVLFGSQADALSNSAGNSAARDPELYVGGNGKLYGELWNGKIDPMSSSVTVDDGQWHYAVLTGSGTTQALWLDGAKVATLSGQISPDGLTKDTAGAGFWGGWPAAYATEGPSLIDTPVGYFGGSIAQAAVYPHPLAQPAIAGQYALAQGASAELTKVTLPSGRVSERAAYNVHKDRVSAYTGPDGGQWQIRAPLTTGYKASSDALGEATRSVTVISPAGFDQVYGFDALNGGRLVSFTPGNGDAPEAFGYDAAGFLNQVQDSDGNLVTMTNDIHGNVLSRTWYPIEPAGSSTLSAAAGSTTSSSCTTTGSACTTYYSYYYNGANPLDPRNDELTGVRDARSASATDNTYLTSYTYNVAGELTSSTTPATSDFPSGRSTGCAYSTTSTAAYGGGTTPAGLVVSETTPGGAMTSFSYYSDGDLAQVTQPGGVRTVYTYDGLGRALTGTTYSDTNPGGLTTTYSYNAMSQPLTVTYPAVTNQVTAVTHTLEDSKAYDGDGNLTSDTSTDLTGGDPARTRTYTYNALGEMASVTDPASATTGYSYNDSGQVSSVVDANGNEYDFDYNEYGEVTQVTLNVNSTSQSVPGGGSSLVLDSYAYDPAGLLATATDAMGRSASYFYNNNGQLVATQNLTSAGTGRQTAYSYDGTANLTQTDVSSVPVTAADQTVTDYAYDAASRLTSRVVDPTPAGTSDSGYANRTTSYVYNADDLMTSQTVSGAGGSSAASYGYDGAGNLTSQSVQDGSTSNTTTWTYDQLGQQVSMTSADGNASGATAADYTTSYAYNQAGNLSQVTGPPVTTSSYAAQTPATTRAVTLYGYDTFGERTHVQDPDGNIITTGYDGDAQITSVTPPSYTPPGSSAAITTPAKYAYDGNGKIISVTDPQGNTVRYAYDALGDLVSKTDPQLPGQSAPGVWSYTYDNDGEPLSATSPTGAQNQATYDEFGDLATSTQDIRGSTGTTYNTTSYTHDYLGDPLTATSPDQVVTTDTYDHLGELTSAANAYGDTVSYAYNYAGQVAQVLKPDGTSDSYGYDPAWNLTSVTAYGTSVPPALPPVLATEGFTYDPAGNRTSATNPRGYTTTYAFNAADELTSQVQPVSASSSDPTSYGYDPAGNQTSVTGGYQNTTWTTYNSWNLPESVIEPATASASAAADRTWTTGYNADGQAASVTQPGGITRGYGYDQVGDLTSETGSGAAAATPAQAFGYDTSGNLISATAPGGTDTFTYNDAGQVTATTGPSGNASFGYNGDGLVTSRTDAAGTTSYTYDKAGRLSTAADPLTGATLTYGYNADSLPATISYAESGTAGPTQSYAYDGLQQLTSDTLTSAAGGTVASAGYGYNADGDLTSLATTGYADAGSTTYGYNQADELTSATKSGATTSYGYDANGDLTRVGGTTFRYNAQDQPVSSTTSAGTTSYAYTLSGALASVTSPSGSVQNYTTNAYGQTVTAPGGISYSYDGLGRLATRATTSGTSAFAYSGTGTTLASDGTTSYTYDPAGGLIGAQRSGNTAQIALTNIHGDVTGTFSPASTTTSLTASQAYDPYGNITATSGTMPAVGYQGQYTDPATGTTKMGARWYNPATGTFTSNDTITGSPVPPTVSPTPYGYVDGNPLTNADPSGHCSIAYAGFDCAVAEQVDEGDIHSAGVGGGGGTGWLVLGMMATTVVAGGWAAYEFATEPGAAPGSPQYVVAGGWWYPHGWQPGWSYNPGGSPGPCAVNCFVPVLPPPPPPPPQDCYAGPDPSCHPPAAPRSLTNGKYESTPAVNTTNPRQIPRGDTIVEQQPTEQQLLAALHEQISGLSANAADNGTAASGQDSATTGHTMDPISQVGKPPTPIPTFSDNPEINKIFTDIYVAFLRLRIDVLEQRIAAGGAGQKPPNNPPAGPGATGPGGFWDHFRDWLSKEPGAKRLIWQVIGKTRNSVLIKLFANAGTVLCDQFAKNAYKKTACITVVAVIAAGLSVLNTNAKVDPTEGYAAADKTFQARFSQLGGGLVSGAGTIPIAFLVSEGVKWLANWINGPTKVPRQRGTSSTSP